MSHPIFIPASVTAASTKPHNTRQSHQHSNNSSAQRRNNSGNTSNTYRNKQPQSNSLQHKSQRSNGTDTHPHTSAPTHQQPNVSIYDDTADSTGKSIVSLDQFTGCTEQSLSIITRILADTYDCSICSETIHARSPVWNCIQCSTMLHLKCIQRYYDTIVHHLSITSQQSQATLRCPTCTYTYIDKPDAYTCFCQAELQPPVLPYVLPHSCGQTCNRALQCHKHHCTQPCHPGPCNKCTRLGEATTCNCGKSTFTLRCGEMDAVDKSCGSVCSKQLSCLSGHTCADVCHPGSCGVCMQPTVQACYCGKHTDVARPCGLASGVHETITELKYSCGEVCDQQLNCGKHRCTQPCHTGPCQPCSRTPTQPQQCACGSETIELGVPRQSCLDDLPTCSNTCNKPLSCGRHTCQQRCHNGPCAQTCDQTMQLACRCLRNVVTVRCTEYDALPRESSSGEVTVKCKTRCTVRLSCGQCQCNELCCSPAVNESHLCTKVCGKPLNCGLHHCDSFHHSGKCHACKVVYTDGLACACGRTRTMPNTVCGTLIRPQCAYPCQRKRQCGHACTYACHRDDCPPCAVLCTKSCAGGHRQLSNIPCYAASPSCGQRCGQQLPCGQHTCAKNCHLPSIPCGLTAISQLSATPSANTAWSNKLKPAAASSTTNGQHTQATVTATSSKSQTRGAEISSCGQKCGKLKSCGHADTGKCHPGTACDESVPCTDTVKLTCPCGRRQQTVRCSQRGSVVLDCVDECERLKRNEAIKSALNVQSAGDRAVTSATTTSLPFPVKLLEQIIATDSMHILAKLEKQVYNFAMSGSTTYHFGQMGNVQRWLIHQLAQCYGVLSESLDVGANRSVRLYKDASNHYVQPHRPAMSLVDAIQLYKQIVSSQHYVDVSGTLHLYGLSVSPNIDPTDLYTILRNYNGMFQCNWFDTVKDHVVLTFSSAATKQAAVTELISKQMFETQPGSDYVTAHNDKDGTALYRRHTVRSHQPGMSTSSSNNNLKTNGWHRSSDGAGKSTVKPRNNAFSLLDDH